jgi:hypothetical protein
MSIKQAFARSLRGQNQGNRPDDLEVRQQRRGGPTMQVPGEGGVASPPGAMNEAGTRGARSAAHFAEPMRRYGGPAVTG